MEQWCHHEQSVKMTFDIHRLSKVISFNINLRSPETVNLCPFWTWHSGYHAGSLSESALFGCFYSISSFQASQESYSSVSS